MAKRIIQELVDDLDGGKAEETIKFSVDGVHYEIDLSLKNTAKFREILNLYTQAGSRIAAERKGTRAGSAPREDTALLNRQVREWAVEHGLRISDRGRVKETYVAAWQAFRTGDKAPLEALQAAEGVKPAVEEPKAGKTSSAPKVAFEGGEKEKPAPRQRRSTKETVSA